MKKFAIFIALTTIAASLFAHEHDIKREDSNSLPISFVIDSSALWRDIKNSEFENSYVPGFYDAADNDIVFNKNRGFNLNYVELSFHSEVDRYFDAAVYFHLQPETFEIAEAYITTKKLYSGLTLKAGKFKSGFGRINSIHHHEWSFDTQPLVYNAMLGPEGLSEPGLQITYGKKGLNGFILGIEVLQGSNERSFGYSEENSLYVGFIKGETQLHNTKVGGGLSLAAGKNADGAESHIWGAELEIGHKIDSFESIVWQSELLYKNQDSYERNIDQAGYYSQIVYKKERFGFGVRYDRIYKNRDSLPENLYRTTVMSEYRFSQSSRLRLQYSHDRSLIVDGERKSVNQLILSLNISAGAHKEEPF